MSVNSQHYVPKFYLNQFTNTNHFCECLDINIDIDKTYKKSPKNLCCENNLYEDNLKEKSPYFNYFEKEFGKIESQIAYIFSKIIKQVNKRKKEIPEIYEKYNAISDSFLSSEEIKKIIKYMIIQIFRTPKGLSGMQEAVQETTKEVYNQNLNGDELKIFTLLQYSNFNTGLLDKMCESIYHNHSFIIFVSNQLQFCTSDNPVVLKQTFSPPLEIMLETKEGELNIKTLELFLPINRNIGLFFATDSKRNVNKSAIFKKVDYSSYELFLGLLLTQSDTIISDNMNDKMKNKIKDVYNKLEIKKEEI